MPEVSVVLPVFNGAATIARAVESILDQTMPDFELIVVDDGSTDATAEIVQRRRDPRLKLIRNAHSGVSTAANAGTDLATAPLIARMDADDFSYPQRLENQIQLLHDQSFDVVGCRVRILNESHEAVPSMRRYERWINEDTIEPDQITALRFVELPLANPTILARRSYFELGFRNDEFPEDYDLMLRAAARGMKFGKVNEVLLDWTDHPTGLTRTDARYSREAFMRCRQHNLLISALDDVPMVDLWGVGQTGKLWLRWLQSQNIKVRRACDINSRKVHQRIHGIPIVHPETMPPADGTPLLIAVGSDKAREIIQPQLLSRGYICGGDAWFVA